MMKNPISCLVLAAALAAPVHAGEAPLAPAPAATSAGNIFTGLNAREDAWYSYLGGNYVLGGDKTASGVLLHAMFGYGGYEYDTLLGGVDADLTEFDFGLGYQWALPSHRLSLIGAYNWVDHDLTGNPIDIANNDSEGESSGFKAKVDIWNTDASRYLYGATATYSTANDDYWSRALVARNFGSFFLGPELIFQGNNEYEECRIGLAVAGIKLGPADLGASVGYAWAEPDQGTDDQDSLYGTIHLSFDF